MTSLPSKNVSEEHFRFMVSSSLKVEKNVGNQLEMLSKSSKMISTVLQCMMRQGQHSQMTFLTNSCSLHKHVTLWQQHFPENMKGVSAEALWQAVNLVEPSLIRVEADEATYNLHIMIRYEVEKRLIAGDLEVDDLPDAWDDMYEEFLGIRSPTRTEEFYRTFTGPSVPSVTSPPTP